ncbi:MAG: hypothetical protein ACRCXD_08495, partial [Luteolibacter sp.]
EINRVSLSFARGTDSIVEGTANAVLSKLYAVPELANPPVTAAVLETATLAMTASMAALVNGGKLATAEKNQRKAVLVDLLKQLAYFVQMKCENSLTLLLASGFQPVSTNRTRTQLPKPVILRVEGGMSGQTVLSVSANPNVRSWQAESALVGEDGSFGPWISAPPATDSRRILVDHQQPGKLYAHHVRGVGGTTGCSDWSNTVTCRAA